MKKAFNVFISHSSIDVELASEMCQYLEEKGISCWMSPRNISPGIDYGQSIVEGIEASAIMVIILSSASNQSFFVKNEVERAAHYRVELITYKIEDIAVSKQLELFLSAAHWLNATKEKPKYHFEELYYSCQVLLEKQTITIVDPVHVERNKKESPFWKIITLAAIAIVIIVGFVMVLKKNNNTDILPITEKKDSIYAKDTIAAQKNEWMIKYNRLKNKMDAAILKADWADAKNTIIELLQIDTTSQGKDYLQQELAKINSKITVKDQPPVIAEEVKDDKRRKQEALGYVTKADNYFDKGENGWKEALLNYKKANNLVAGAGNKGADKFIARAKEILKFDPQDQAGVAARLKGYANEIRSTKIIK